MTSPYSRPPTPAALQQLVEHADLAIQFYCNQISRDYLAFIKQHVLKDLPEYSGISYRELKIITLMDDRSKNPLRSAQIASILRIDAATVTRGISKLVRENYVLSGDDPYDDRAKTHVLTEKAQTLSDAYRQKCLSAIRAANVRLNASDTEAMVNDGYAALYAAKDRAHAIGNVKFRSRQTFLPGQGQGNPGFTTPDEVFRDYSDFVFQIFADQISLDYLSFYKKHIVPDMREKQVIAMRELRILLCLDFFKRPVTAADIAAVMRIEPATVSRALPILINEGLLTSLDSDTDGRSKVLSVSEQGRDFAEQFRAVSQQKIQAAEAHLGLSWDQEKRITVLRDLTKIKERSAQLAALKPPRIPSNVIEGHFQDNEAQPALRAHAEG